jgi:hypothetical protein
VTQRRNVEARIEKYLSSTDNFNEKKTFRPVACMSLASISRNFHPPSLFNKPIWGMAPRRSLRICIFSIRVNLNVTAFELNIKKHHKSRVSVVLARKKIPFIHPFTISRQNERTNERMNEKTNICRKFPLI